MIVVRFGVSTGYFIIATSFPGEARFLPILASGWSLEGCLDYG